jgi:hypothetical protein
MRALPSSLKHTPAAKAFQSVSGTLEEFCLRVRLNQKGLDRRFRLLITALALLTFLGRGLLDWRYE